MSVLNIDEHLTFIEREAKEVLTVSEASTLEIDLKRAPWTVVQKHILQVINGKLQFLTTLDLSEPNAMLKAARIQGEISGLRTFFDIAADLLSMSQEKEEIT